MTSPDNSAIVRNLEQEIVALRAELATAQGEKQRLEEKVSALQDQNIKLSLDVTA